jgi:hypothetical protein
MEQLNQTSLTKLNVLDDDEQTLVECKSNLDIYSRSQLACHAAKGEEDTNVLAKNMMDNEACVTMDLKNNILDCFYHENMMRFFGQSGTTNLGAITLINCPDNSTTKKAHFVHFTSNDKLKDTQLVMSAKHGLYSNLPDRIKKV